LKQIAIAADHDDRITALLECQGAENVVGLTCRRSCRRNAERVQYLQDHVDLWGEFVGHLFDVGLVARFFDGDAVRLV
jgi:hypothetical protein